MIDEETIVFTDERESSRQVLFKTGLRRVMKGDETAFVELRCAHDQAVGSEVGKAQGQGLADTQAGGGEQAEQRAVRQRSQRALGREPTSLGDQPCDVFARENVWNWPLPRAGEQVVGRNVMAAVLPVDVAGEAGDSPQAPVAFIDRGSRTRPGQRGLAADERVAALLGKARESVQYRTCAFVREAEGAPHRDVRGNEFCQHEVTSGQGWATSLSRAPSTLA